MEEKIKEFVEKNFRIHSDWTGECIEANQDTIGRTLENLENKLLELIKS